MNHPASAQFELNAFQTTENAPSVLTTEAVSATNQDQQPQPPSEQPQPALAVASVTSEFDTGLPRIVPVRPSVVNIEPAPSVTSAIATPLAQRPPTSLPTSQTSAFVPATPTTASAARIATPEMAPPAVFECILCRKLFPTSEDLIEHHETDHTVDARLRKFVPSNQFETNERTRRGVVYNNIDVGDKIMLVHPTEANRRDLTAKRPDLLNKIAIVTQPPIYPNTWLKCKIVDTDEEVAIRPTNMKVLETKHFDSTFYQESVHETKRRKKEGQLAAEAAQPGPEATTPKKAVSQSKTPKTARQQALAKAATQASSATMEGTQSESPFSLNTSSLDASVRTTLKGSGRKQIPLAPPPQAMASPAQLQMPLQQVPQQPMSQQPMSQQLMSQQQPMSQVPHVTVAVTGAPIPALRATTMPVPTASLPMGIPISPQFGGMMNFPLPFLPANAAQLSPAQLQAMTTGALMAMFMQQQQQQQQALAVQMQAQVQGQVPVQSQPQGAGAAPSSAAPAPLMFHPSFQSAFGVPANKPPASPLQMPMGQVPMQIPVMQMPGQAAPVQMTDSPKTPGMFAFTPGFPSAMMPIQFAPQGIPIVAMAPQTTNPLTSAARVVPTAVGVAAPAAPAVPVSALIPAQQGDASTHLAPVQQPPAVGVPIVAEHALNVDTASFPQEPAVATVDTFQPAPIQELPQSANTLSVLPEATSGAATLPDNN